MASGSFTRKKIEVKVTLREGEFSGGGNTKTLTDLPIHVRVEKNGPPDFCKANVDIRGMKYDDMDKLSTLAFKPQAIAKNVLAIYAGDEENGTSLVFQGEIDAASADFNMAPDINFAIEAKAGIYGMTTAKGPTAIKGNQQCASFCEMIAKEMGYSFENQGVTAQLSNAVFNGSPVQQARAAASQVGAELLIDDGTMKLIPAGGSGNTGNAVVLGKNTGMLGYPVITSDGLDLKALYNPDFELGGYVKVESIVPGAAGVWRIAKLTHDLVAHDPQGGPWESQLSVVQVSEGKAKKPEDKDIQTGLGVNPGGLPSNVGVNLIAPALSFAFDTTEQEDIFSSGYNQIRQGVCDNNSGDKTDCTLLCLPDISASMSERTDNTLTRQGWIYLRDLFLKWFNSPGNDNANNCDEPYWVDWNWAIKQERVAKKYKELISTYILNVNAKNKLGEILKRNGYLADDHDNPVFFDFTQTEWRNLQDRYHTEIGIDGLTDVDLNKWDGVGIALGGCSIRALAKGYTVKKESGGHEIHVTKLGVFIRDAFHFERDNGLVSEYLGAWDCKTLSCDTININYTILINRDFRNFRDKYGKGGDFLVLSQVHPIELPNEVKYDYKQ